MDKMKRIFSFVLAFVITLGAFSSFSTIALADEVEEAEENKEEVENVEDEKEEEKEEEEEEAEKPADKPAGTDFLKEVPEDVIGTDYEKSVRRLVAFGVVGGYPDGTFKPERELNRAQFATMVVQALGLDDAMEATAENKTGFTDVADGYWGAGAINIASSQGLIKGFPDGTFRPAAKVTYAQVLTVLVRALGYEDQFLYGNWPSNYISKAADLGITKGIDLPKNYNTTAIRGNVARLFDETLHTNVIEVKEYEGTAITYEPTKTPLMKDKLNINLDRNLRIVGDKFVDSKLKDDQVKLYDRTAKKTKVVSMENSAVQYRQFIGSVVDTYSYDDVKNTVLLVEGKDESDAKFDFVVDAYEVRSGVMELKLAGHANKFRLADDAVFYVFDGDGYSEYAGKKELSKSLIENLKGRVGRVVVDGGDIVYGEIMAKDQVIEDFMVVKEVKDDNIKGITAKGLDSEINFGKASQYKGVYVFDQDGKQIEVKDINAGDVLYAQKQYFGRDDQLFITVVQDNNVTGELGRTTADSMEIGKDKEYIAKTKNAEKAIGQVSMDLLESSDNYTKEDAAELYEEDVIAYRGAGDLVVMLAANDDSAGVKYGIITRVDDRDGRLTITTTLDGKKMETTRFTLENDDDMWSGNLSVVDASGKVSNKAENKSIVKKATDNAKPEKVLVGQPVRFRVNKDDKIAKGSLRFTDLKSARFENVGNKTVRFTNNVVYMENPNGEKASKTLRVAENAKVVEAYGLSFKDMNEGKLDARDLRDVADDTVIYDYKDIAMTETEEDLNLAVFTRANGDVEAIVIFEEGANKLKDIDSAEEAIIVTDLGKRGEDYSVKYHSYQAGKQVDKDRNFRNEEGLADEGGLNIISINRRGRVSIVDPDESEMYDEIKSNVRFDSLDHIAHNVVVYDKTKRELKEINVDRVKDSDIVSAIVTKEGVAEVIVVEEPGDKEDDGKTPELSKDAVYTLVEAYTRNNEHYAVFKDVETGKELKPVAVSVEAYNKLTGSESEDEIDGAFTARFRGEGEDLLVTTVKEHHLEVEKVTADNEKGEGTVTLNRKAIDNKEVTVTVTGLDNVQVKEVKAGDKEVTFTFNKKDATAEEQIVKVTAKVEKQEKAAEFDLVIPADELLVAKEAYEKAVEEKVIGEDEGTDIKLDKDHADAITGITDESTKEDYEEAKEIIEKLTVGTLEKSNNISIAAEEDVTEYTLEDAEGEKIDSAHTVKVYAKDKGEIEILEPVGETRKDGDNDGDVQFHHIFLNAKGVQGKFIIAEDADGNMIYAVISAGGEG